MQKKISSSIFFSKFIRKPFLGAEDHYQLRIYFQNSNWGFLAFPWKRVTDGSEDVKYNVMSLENKME